MGTNCPNCDRGNGIEIGSMPVNCSKCLREKSEAIRDMCREERLRSREYRHWSRSVVAGAAFSPAVVLR